MSNKLTKAETVALIAEETGAPKTQVKLILDAAETVVARTLAAGDSLPVLGGVFKTVSRSPRTVANPQKPGQKISVAASTGVNFKPGTGLKAALNQ